MITILSLDTTSRYASISIAGGEEIHLEYNFAARDELSSSLIPSLEFVLNSMPLKLDDIDVYGIGIGPGLFTGIRVGLATLKGLLLGTGKPVVPVVTLRALAYKYNDSTSPVISMIDARRGELYIAAYRFVKRHAEELLPPGLVHIDQLKHHLEPLAECKKTKFNFVGSGAEAHKTFIKENFPRVNVCRRSCFLASEICKVAYHYYSKKNYITDLQQLMPFYIRKPDAEQNLERSRQ
jgi:tRNA threonylcarbamoyl adenosine modification protein YeaZ